MAAPAFHSDNLVRKGRAINISVFGTGDVVTAIAIRLKALGHAVVFGSREPGADEQDIAVLSHQEAARHGDWLVNALHGEHAMATFPGLSLSGKLLVDIGNWQSAIDGPIVETLGESLQRALPQTRVVKADDPAARAEVTQLLEAFGWRDIFDLGDLTACRAMESLAPMWMRLNSQLGHVWFNLAVVRNAG